MANIKKPAPYHSPQMMRFKPLWEARGYSMDMASAGIMIPPPVGWRRLYHITSTEYALSNIEHNRLKIARFNDLNDPFELYALDSDNARTRRKLIEYKQKWDATHGLLCFSADWADPVLWSHYGKRHQGICLGYDVEEGLARTVVYRKDRILEDQLSDDFDEQMQLTKFKSWEYESEWRVLTMLNDAHQEGGLHFYRTGDKIKLREVILGHFCDQDLHQVRKFVTTLYPEAHTFKARLGYKFFGITPDLPSVRGLPGWAASGRYSSDTTT